MGKKKKVNQKTYADLIGQRQIHQRNTLLRNVSVSTCAKLKSEIVQETLYIQFRANTHPTRSRVTQIVCLEISTKFNLKQQQIEMYKVSHLAKHTVVLALRML